ncbi:hypothetical protein LQZ18_07815 [Lachnospiraceae bacterium ZAX-1]
MNAGSCSNCYNMEGVVATATSGSAYAGGIAGCGWNDGGSYSNCYNMGEVATTGADAYVGG